MELKLLRAFVTVAEHRHFGVAAQHLRLAQPQVSRRIAQLESDLNLSLFIRSSRSVVLTEVREAFLPEAIAVLKRADTARHRAMERARGRNGLLKVSLIDGAMVGAVPPILRAFHRQYPNVYLSFRNPDSTSSALIDALGDGSADVVFTHPPPSRMTENYDQLLLVNDPLVVALPQDHRLANQAAISLSELAQEPWIMFPRENDPTIYDRIITLCRRQGFSPQIAYETGRMMTRFGLVASGFGVHLVHAAWREMPYPGVAYIPIDPTARVRLSCLWRRGSASPLVRNLIDVARTYTV